MFLDFVICGATGLKQEVAFLLLSFRRNLTENEPLFAVVDKLV